MQVGLERVQHAGSHAAGQQRLDAVGAQVAAHGLEVQVQFAAIARIDRPRSRSSWVWSYRCRVCSTRTVSGHRGTTGSGVSGAGTTDSGRQAWCVATSRSTCWQRLSHRCHRSATCISPPHRGGRVASRRSPQLHDRSAHPPAGARRPGRPALCRSGAAGAARTHPHRAPSPDRPADPAAHGSTAAASTGSPPYPIDRLTAIPNDAANRDPARPAKANPTATNAPCRPALRRACRSVNPGTCSTKVPAEQSTWSQKNRRTVNHTTSGRPETGRSATRRRYRLCTRVDTRPHPRQRDPRARPCAATTTASSTRPMPSITTDDRCGSRTRQQSLGATDPEHHAHARQASLGWHHGMCARTR